MNEQIEKELFGDSARKIPGRAFYFLGAGIIVAGIALFLGLLLSGLLGMTSGYIRVVAPGSSNIVIPIPGEYVIFHEYKSKFNGKRYDVKPGLGDLECQIENTSTGNQLKPQPEPPTSHYTARTGSGISIFRVRIDEPGEYRFKSAFLPGKEPVETVLCIKRWNTARGPLYLLRSWSVLGSSLAIGGAIIFITARRRARGTL